MTGVIANSKKIIKKSAQFVKYVICCTISHILYNYSHYRLYIDFHIKESVVFGQEIAINEIREV